MPVDFSQVLSAPPGEERTITLQMNDLPVQVRFLGSALPTNRLLVRFHGAVAGPRAKYFEHQKNSRQLAPFCHQVTIFDPTPLAFRNVPIAWYAGHPGFEAQKLLPALFHGLANALGAERTVYWGGSGGGFASLFYSFQHEGSIALTLVPQTRILHYRLPRAFEMYAEACWPGLSHAEISGRVCLDVGKLYASRPARNAVIYVVSPGDRHHVAEHMVPFLSEIHRNLPLDQTNVTPVSDYWGIKGHSGAIPIAGSMPWIRAALASRTISQDDILGAYHAFCKHAAPTPAERPTHTVREFSDGDLQLSRLLQQYQLGSEGRSQP